MAKKASSTQHCNKKNGGTHARVLSETDTQGAAKNKLQRPIKKQRKNTSVKERILK